MISIFSNIGCINYSFSLDFYNHSAVIVFLLGCNLRCSYCYNWRLVFGEKIMSDDEINQYLNRDYKFIDAVVISGGEPTIYSIQDLFELIDFFKMKNPNIKVKIDTNGSNPNKIKELIKLGYIDAIGLDIKASILRLESFKKILPTMKENYIVKYVNNLISTIKIIYDNIKYFDLIEFRTVKLSDEYDDEIKHIKNDLISMGFGFDFSEDKKFYKYIDNGTTLIYRINEKITKFGTLEQNIME